MAYIQFLINVTLVGVLYFPIFPQLLNNWGLRGHNSQGIFIPFLLAYFLWAKRSELKETPLSSSYEGVLLILAGLGVYVFSRASEDLFLQGFSMLIVISGLVMAQAGRKMLKKTAFPICFSIFMLPIPWPVRTAVTSFLVAIVIKVIFFLIKVLGVDATMNGNLIIFPPPTTTLAVNSLCSGIRSLIVFMLTSLALGYLFQKSVRKRVILFAFSIVLAICMNLVRVFLIVVSVSVFRLEALPRWLHDGSGIVAVIIGSLLLFWVNSAMGERNDVT